MEALRQALVHCKMLEEQRDYEPVSLRGVLYTLGFTESEADEAIRFAHSKGFNYCIDPMFPAKSYPDFEEKPTPSFACYWGPDQLRSRLEWVLPFHYQGA